ncbi:MULTISPECIES: cation diffusion facilitator family transporter [Bradyrhizobium]|jgi:cobalt-zinc-cadmium efflux system protein|uniref:cation diffusion facilitator family transporter n=1 Tax=Bradyrhizobium TaxID=374 RepID=UPI00202331C8|nr:cation diffusion facilitator family transporter [Bradyrhizobium denitrificans]MCL8483381.1 cation diffusion facilitator family transporter [Bradyrhizobium denitrificans]
MHGGGTVGTAGARHANKLAWALAMTATYMIAEVIGGLVTGSLALLADAAHMLTDVGGLALALLAIRFAAREATPQRTFGYLRMEVLSALANAVVLLLLTVYILYEAYQRFLSPPEVLSGPMLIVACIGLVVNLISMWLLSSGSSESLNVKGAYFEVLSDMLGSIGVIVAALLMMWKGWALADPIIGAGIGLFIVPRTWSLLSQVTHILMEGTPPNVDTAAIEKKLLAISGTVAVHDLHVWTVTSGFDAMSCHLVVTDMSAGREALRTARNLMKAEYGIEHTTIQVEDEAMRAEEAVLHV